MMNAKMLNNLESVGELLGALKAVEEGLEEDEYMEGIIKQAHGKAANAFNVAAAATASAGILKHVFEFGTTGITAGAAKYPDPTSPAARLWIHRLEGRGGQQDISYTFRPALNRNPKPTTESTGVPSKYLRKLSNRKYVFWNKAYVMETGQTVEIKSRQPHGLLFVPTPGNNAPKNHVMWNANRLGPIKAQPGRTTRGTFTAFWMNWWGSQGGNIMEQDMRKTITSDVEKAMAEATKRANAAVVKPAETNNIPGAAARAKSFVKKLFGPRQVNKVI